MEEAKEGRVTVPGLYSSAIPGLAPMWSDALSVLPVGVSIANLIDGRILYSNPAFDTIVGCEPGYYKSAFEFVEHACIVETQREKLRAQVQNTLRSSAQRVSLLPEMGLDVLGGDGRVRTVQHYGVVMSEADIVIAVFRQISHQQQAYYELRQAVLTDPLTGVANRRGMRDYWRRMIEQKPDCKLAFLMLDLDGFKPVNDEYGHRIGDEVLCVIAKRLQACVRKTDLVIRFGGDEFGILLDVDCPQGGDPVDLICEQMVASIREPIHVSDGVEVFVTTSLGGCRYPEQASSYEELLRHADQAMYRVKQVGKNGWGWY